MATSVDIEWKIREAKSAPEIFLLLKKYHASMSELCWLRVFRSQHFSSKIFDEYEKEIPWGHIATIQDIPDKYLNKYIDEMDLFEISSFQPLSLTFIKKYYHLLSIDQLIKNERLSKEAKLYVNKLYERVKDDPSFHRRWDENLSENLVFSPKDFQGHYNDYDGTTPFPVHTNIKIKAQEAPKQKIIVEKTKSAPKKVPTVQDYMGKSKAELKAILEERKVRVYYHDTLDILRQKCVDSEVVK